jgi:hypothetical protein
MVEPSSVSCTIREQGRLGSEVTRQHGLQPARNHNTSEIAVFLGVCEPVSVDMPTRLCRWG